MNNNNNEITNKSINKNILNKEIVTNMSEINDLNNMEDFDNDNIRAPIPTMVDKLISYNPEDIDEFEIFKQKIELNDSIDPDLKEIMIQSRKDSIDKFELKSKSNIEKIMRANIICCLSAKLKLNSNNNTGITQQENSFILFKINEWIDGNIKTIKLNSNTLYQLFQIIDIIKNERQNINSIEIKNIFEPEDYFDYISLVDTIKIINKKIAEEKIEKKKLEEEKLDKIKFRQELLSLLMLNLNKLSLFDNKIKTIKDEIEPIINKYINLEIEYIELNNESSENLIKFLNSIRISRENKDNILKLLKII